MSYIYSLLTALFVDQQQKFKSKCWSERARDSDTPSSSQEGFYCGHIRNCDFAERSPEGQEDFGACLFHRTGPTDRTVSLISLQSPHGVL